MHNYTLNQLSQALKKKQFSSFELTEHYLNRIKRLDPQLNSYITVLPDQALADARNADEKLAKVGSDGSVSPFCGIPLAHKDIFCTKGIKTTCASRMLENFIAPYDAAIIERGKTVGSVLLGKTNLDEFAMGSSNENSYFGPVKNPWKLTCTPGGSSGGSAAAVAGRLTPICTGTDTGGSIRQPASFCNLTGLKPTYGRVSRYGQIAFASSLDQTGPIARSAEDAALFMNLLAGFDSRDSTSSKAVVPDYTKNLNNSLENLRIGLPQEYFDSNLDSQIGEMTELAIAEYEKLGAKIQFIQLPSSKMSISAYYVVSSAECSSNLARYDGVRYGYRCENPRDLDDLYKRSRTEGFGKEVKRRIMIGTYILSSGYHQSYYHKANKICSLIAQDFRRAFEEVDIIMGPTTPTPAFELGSKINDPVTMYLSDIYTISANLAGLPALSHGIGFVNGLPIGLQLIGNYFSEDRLLNAAHRYQQVTEWHKRVPEGF